MELSSSNLRKFITPFYLGVVWLLSLVLNNLSDSWYYAHGSDEYTYIGSARRLIFFENKDFTLIPFKDSPLLLSYWIGLVSFFSHIPIEFLFRLFHGLGLLFLIVMTYKIGRRFNLMIAFFLPALIGFSPSPDFYPGLAYLLPSFFLSIFSLLIIDHLSSTHYKFVVLDLLLVLFFYPYAFPIFLIFLFFYFNFIYLKKLSFIPILLFGCFYFLSPNWDLLSSIPILNLILTFTNWSGGGTDFYFHQFYNTYFIYFIPLAIGLIFVFLKPSIRQRFSFLLFSALALTSTSLFLFFFVNPYIYIRTLFLLYVALFIVISIGFYSLYYFLQTRYLKMIVSGLIILYIFSVTFYMGTIYAHSLAPFPPFDYSEIQAFEWLQNNYDMPSTFIVSDYYTLVASLAYTNSLNSNFMVSKHGIIFYSEEEKEVAFMLSNPETPFMGDIADFLSSPFLTGDSFNLIQTIFNDFKPTQLIVIISPRTRQTLGINYLGNFFPSSVLDTTSVYPSLTGEAKFKTNNFYFNLVYDNGETQVYEYNSIE